MNRLKTTLQSKKVLFLLTLGVLIYIMIYNLLPKTSHYQEGEITIFVTVESYTIEEINFTIEGKAKEPIIIYGTFPSEKEKNQFSKEISIGDKLKVTGTLKEFTSQTYPNLFSYKDYAKTKGVFYMMKLSSYEIVGHTWRTYLYKWFHKYEWKYTDTYFFMNSSVLPLSYKEVNWIPLFNIYSIHLRTFKKCKPLYLLILLLLLFTTNFSPKIIVLFFLYYLRRKKISFSISIYLSLLLRLLLEPYMILTSSFLYLIMIYIAIIIIMRKKIKNQLLISYLLNFITIPIFAFQNFYFNPLFFLVQPFVLYFVSFGFIGALINCIIPFQIILDSYFNVLTEISECLRNTNIFTISLAKLPIWLFIICYFFCFICFYGIITKKICYTMPILIFFFLHHFIPTLISYQDIFYLDVGQGDSILIRIDKKNILIDSGGIMGLGITEKRQTEKMIKNKMIPFFRSIGITKLDYVIITHGDYDHIGGMSTLIKEIPIEKIFFNSNQYNELERNLLKKLDKQKISYNRITNASIKTENSVISLFSMATMDENAASVITSLKYKNDTFLFLADATIETIEKYIAITDLKNVEILKIPHHGSKNNINEKIIQTLSPRYAIISAGRNNLYHHPSPIVIDLLAQYHISCLTTQKNGTIRFSIKKGVFQTNPA